MTALQIWVEIAPFQHGYESVPPFHCWALQACGRPCPYRSNAGDYALLGLPLCRQHALAVERNGFRIVRLTADQLRHCLADLAAEKHVEVLG